MIRYADGIWAKLIQRAAPAVYDARRTKNRPFRIQSMIAMQRPQSSTLPLYGLPANSRTCDMIRKSFFIWEASPYTSACL